MPRKLKTFECGSAIITVWDTRNITLQATEPIELDILDSCLIQNGILVLPDLHNFVEQMNALINKGKHWSFLYRTQPHKDACLTYLSNYGLYVISPDEMSITAKFSKTATTDNVIRDLANIGIVHGIDEQAIETALSDLLDDPAIIATGTLPKAPRSRQYSFDFLAERPRPVSMRHNDNVSFIDFSIRNQTLAGDKIGTYTEPLEGEFGTSVSGHTIPPPLEIEDDVHLLEQVEERHGEVFALISGMIDFDHKIVDIIPIKLINRPLLNQTIEFDGTVIVYSTTTNCRIMAKNDVYLHGLVFDTHVSAGGFVYLMNGIRGRKSKVTTKQDIFSSFTHYTEMTSTDGNIYIAYECYHSHLRAKGSVVVDNTFSDGSIYSETGIRTLIAGNARSGDKTLFELHVGQKEKDELSDLMVELHEAERKLKVIYSEKKRFHIQNMSIKTNLEENPEYIQVLCKETAVIHLIQDLRDKITSIRNFIEDRIPQILITEAVHHGTTIKINEFELQIGHEQSYPSHFSEGMYGITRKRYE